MAVLAVKTVLQRMMEITGAEEEEERRGLLTSSQRVRTKQRDILVIKVPDTPP